MFCLKIATFEELGWFVCSKNINHFEDDNILANQGVHPKYLKKKTLRDF